MREIVTDCTPESNFLIIDTYVFTKDTSAFMSDLITNLPV